MHHSLKINRALFTRLEFMSMEPFAIMFVVFVTVVVWFSRFTRVNYVINFSAFFCPSLDLFTGLHN